MAKLTARTQESRLRWYSHVVRREIVMWENEWLEQRLKGKEKEKDRGVDEGSSSGKNLRTRFLTSTERRTETNGGKLFNHSGTPLPHTHGHNLIKYQIESIILNNLKTRPK